MTDLDEPVIHYCWICGVEEQCKDEECDFRELFKVHGYCMTNIRELIKHDTRSIRKRWK